MSRYWSKLVQSLEPYVPGEQPKISNLIKLNTNENPYGPAPSVLEAIQAHTNNDLRLYPDPNSDNMKVALAQYYGVQPEQVFVGNGSDEVLAHTFQALLKHDKPLLFPDITYSFYPVYCQLYDVQYRKVPLTDRFTINPDDYGIENGGIIFPNPNAPTGTAMALEQVEAILKANPDSVVVVDEAYVDFGAASAVSLLPSYPNLLVVQTFSKSRSLAALRIGFALGSAELVDALERVKNSFNSYPVDRLAQQAAVASLADEAYFESTCQRIISTRDNLTRELSLLDFEVLPSSANFVFARHRVRDAREISQHLRSQSVIVRYFEKDRIDQFLRITIGTEKECDTLISVLKDYLS